MALDVPANILMQVEFSGAPNSQAPAAIFGVRTVEEIPNHLQFLRLLERHASDICAYNEAW